MSAMAASTWFHGSQWPPGNHGIMPSGRCRATMDWAVASTSVGAHDAGDLGDHPHALAPTGSRAAATVTGRLHQVDHEALADQRVEHPLRRAGHAGRLLDVPHQQAVVGGDGRVRRRWSVPTRHSSHQ